MNAHTWIFVIAILLYLYYLSRVYDRVKFLSIKRARIHEPQSDDESALTQWVHDMRQIKRETTQLRKNSCLYFFIIPALEIITHFISGDYYIADQLLTLSFLLGFSLTMIVILYWGSEKYKMPNGSLVKKTTY
ncbi:hypothetical protein K6119_00175 [Paracrocinitomix mangrovi]|uniref:hypothetical protein n=1 Tax=Paracrocinitomix mangrovi TaxID=2862509 RepID=UPI001C8F131D|nr:hypothetical protein [Paracrocinitomix mangrovi]UKN01931.1 hypothetical protein K6119_00175 [Paracrocinitomix mangrovi]